MVQKIFQEGKLLQETIDGDKRHYENSIKGADDIIADANVTLWKALLAKKLDRNVIQDVQPKTEIGIDRKTGSFEKAESWIIIVINLYWYIEFFFFFYVLRHWYMKLTVTLFSFVFAEFSIALALKTIYWKKHCHVPSNI